MTSADSWRIFNDLEKLKKEIHRVVQGIIVLSLICALILVFADFGHEIIRDYMMIMISFLFGTYIGVNMIDSQLDKIMESEYE